MRGWFGGAGGLDVGWIYVTCVYLFVALLEVLVLRAALLEDADGGLGFEEREDLVIAHCIVVRELRFPAVEQQFWTESALTRPRRALHWARMGLISFEVCLVSNVIPPQCAHRPT
ncbi:hypothetical protein BU16DRAFT_125351 [Lophium mytilinum]|uniref:Uncharacterized protein n=1 Tax=Lophium mytilinum TaxID=390894 RepID=A0A6A6QHU3_9PEZI|nr:hypothetical protein BU16DRAFT_125351 [Lophium mytilinum]